MDKITLYNPSSPNHVTNHFDFSHATFNINSTNIQRKNNEDLSLVSSASQGAMTEKTHSWNWVKIVEIIVAILGAVQALITIVPYLFALLC